MSLSVENNRLHMQATQKKVIHTIHKLFKLATTTTTTTTELTPFKDSNLSFRRSHATMAQYTLVKVDIIFTVAYYNISEAQTRELLGSDSPRLLQEQTQH
jgi:hypothetical protein